MKIPRKNSNNSSGTRRPEKSKVPTFIKSIFFLVGELDSIVCVGGGGGGERGGKRGRGSPSLRRRRRRCLVESS